MLTYNIKLYSKLKNEIFLKETLYQICKLYNFISNIVFENNYKNLNLKNIHNLVYNKARLEFSNLPSQIIVKTYKEVLSNYRTIKSNKHKIDKPISKTNLSLRLDKRIYSNFNQNSINLFSNIKQKRQPFNLILFPKVKQLFEQYQTFDPLLFIKNDQLYLSVTFKTNNIIINNESKVIDENKVLGIDRGIRRLITTSDGLIILGKEFQKHKRKQLFLKRKLQSKNTKSSKKHLKKLKNKEHNFSKNYIHHVANKLLQTEKEILVFENLSKIKQNTSRIKSNKNIKNKKHNRRLSQIPFFMLLQIISYKAQHVGKRIATVSPYMTSQEDHRGIQIGSRVGCRYYTFDGKQFDSDINAALNIKNKYLKQNNLNHLSSQYPLDITYESRLLSISHMFEKFKFVF